MKRKNAITSIIDFYDPPRKSYTDSLYSMVIDDSNSKNLDNIIESSKTNPFKFRQEDKKNYPVADANGMSYFSKTNEIQESLPLTTGLLAIQPPNMFKEAIKRLSDTITNINKEGEEAKFKRFGQYISIEVNGVKKIYDIFNLFNGATKTLVPESKKLSVSQKISSFFKKK